VMSQDGAALREAKATHVRGFCERARQDSNL
jgi:hypothetical protein